MAKNNNVNVNYDSNRIAIRTFDPTADAVRIIHAQDVTTEISLSHKDNDTVAAMSASRYLAANTSVDCSDLSKVQSYGAGTMTLTAATGINIEIPVSSGTVYEICAMTLTCTAPLVGR